MSDMKKFESGAVREDKTGKGRMDLLPMCALMRVARHMENSLERHPERNWELGMPMHSFMDSAIRHIFMYMDGQNDEDHLCSAAWNILCAMWTEEKKPEMMDIPSRTGIKNVSKSKSNQHTCSSFIPNGDFPYGRCLATKEIDMCDCGGIKTECDFYVQSEE